MHYILTFAILVVPVTLYAQEKQAPDHKAQPAPAQKVEPQVQPAPKVEPTPKPMPQPAPAPKVDPVPKPPEPRPEPKPEQPKPQVKLEERHVHDYYRKYLGRQATPNDVRFWTQRLATPNEVRINILSSDEYYRRHGGNLRVFIQALFFDVLGRAPTQQELVFFINRPLPRRQLVVEFFTQYNVTVQENLQLEAPQQEMPEQEAAVEMPQNYAVPYGYTYTVPYGYTYAVPYGYTYSYGTYVVPQRRFFFHRGRRW